MKKLLLALSLFLGLSYVFSQAKIIKDVGDFTTLRIFDKIPVELISSSEGKVEVDGIKNGDVQVINKDGQLKIRMTALKLLDGDNVKVKVYYKKLNDIQASEGARIKGKERMDGGILSLSVKEGAKVELDVEVQKVIAKVNTGGEIYISGKSKDQDILITSGGEYHSKDLNTQKTIVTINAGGNAEVTASNSIEAKTRAGGIIDVYGSPKNINQKTFAGGKINIY